MCIGLEEGELFMTMGEFYQFFAYISVQWIRKDYLYSTQVLELQQRKAIFLELKTSEKLMICLRLFQSSKQLQKTDFRLYRLVDEKIVNLVANNTADSWEPQTITYLNRRQPFVELVPGK